MHEGTGYESGTIHGPGNQHGEDGSHGRDSPERRAPYRPIVIIGAETVASDGYWRGPRTRCDLPGARCCSGFRTGVRAVTRGSENGDREDTPDTSALHGHRIPLPRKNLLGATRDSVDETADGTPHGGGGVHH